MGLPAGDDSSPGMRDDGPPCPPLVVVGGPTATGKTDLAIRLALALSADGRCAEVVSADSRQVYRGMDVGTAKPNFEERRGIPHHGLDLVDPDEDFSVSQFADHVAAVLPRIAAGRGVAILAGGTGFWLRAIADGLALDDLPHDAALRVELGEMLDRDGAAALAAALQAEAPVLAGGVDLLNPRRVLRALEIARLRGDGPLPAPRGYGGPVVRVLVDVVDRARHRHWIAERSERQLDGGILPEAAGLRERFGTGLRAFSSIGYREAWDLLDGRLDRAGYLAANSKRNVDFARRQRTWFRRERADVFVDAGGPDPLARVIEAVRAGVAVGG
jgi:tRNA dimethylallyltransferase